MFWQRMEKLGQGPLITLWLHVFFTVIYLPKVFKSWCLNHQTQWICYRGRPLYNNKIYNTLSWHEASPIYYLYKYIYIYLWQTWKSRSVVVPAQLTDHKGICADENRSSAHLCSITVLTVLKSVSVNWQLNCKNRMCQNTEKSGRIKYQFKANLHNIAFKFHVYCQSVPIRFNSISNLNSFFLMQLIKKIQT